MRAEVFNPSEICIVHCVQRCVRRSYLTGFDQVSGKDYKYRREWIRTRMEKLASVFGIDCLSYAIMSNHLHVVVRSRPDVVKTWSDKKVALHWLQIFPGERIDEQLGDPTTVDVETLANDTEKIAQVRNRLSDISWYMRALSEPIARYANKEDACTGSFWEGRFKAQKIVDEAGLLACAMYVELNPIRAAMAETPEKSLYTSAYDRIESGKGAKVASAAAAMQTIPREEAVKLLKHLTPKQLAERRKACRKRRGAQVARDAWLAPLTLDERKSVGPQVSREGLRASDKGFLSMSQEDYLALLDWTGRAKKAGKTGEIPKDLAPILVRLGIEGSMWCDLVWNYKKYFGRSTSAGKPEAMKEHAHGNKRAYTPGQKRAKECFV
jgi:REP element-mobilizing transposase RayT